MSPETSCVAHFSWHYRGSEKYRSCSGSNVEATPLVYKLIEQGAMNLYKKNSAYLDFNMGDQSTQKHKYLKFREYVGNNINS
jgi:hypothetical protein